MKRTSCVARKNGKMKVTCMMKAAICIRLQEKLKACSILPKKVLFAYGMKKC
ncbi:MAG: hypothetical protein ACREVX_11595 [Clostridium sp.]|uniref:hypothetical protein n=1 Tax=Clostridium sp. TaxID=1506 RepID=UPI003D6C7250